MLGVARDAGDDEIKKAYRKLAHQYHPDKGGGDEEKFKEISEAYGVLGNKEKRARYDQFGHAGAQGGFGGAGQGFGGFDFSQFGGDGAQFEFGGDMGDLGDILGGMFGGARRSRTGHDVQASVTITFAEMVAGVRKDVHVRRMTACGGCGGTGGAAGATRRQCATCGGAGRVRRTVQTVFGAMAQTALCDACAGRGETYDKVCAVCNGVGRESRTENISIDIPAGIEHGQTIALTGMGDAGAHGAPAGDLLVTVAVQPDARFRREGETIRSTIQVSLSMAALGGKTDVATVDGDVTMKIPEGTQSGETFRLRGRGVPRLRGLGRGDHLVTVTVEVPHKLSRAQKKLFEQLREEGL